jgi:hypothetical protein
MKTVIIEFATSPKLEFEEIGEIFFLRHPTSGFVELKNEKPKSSCRAHLRQANIVATHERRTFPEIGLTNRTLLKLRDAINRRIPAANLSRGLIENVLLILTADVEIAILSGPLKITDLMTSLAITGNSG